MSLTKQTSSISGRKEKDQVLQELGDVTIVGQVLSPEEDRRILRQIDMKLLPVMAISYLFQFLDKAALGYTAIMTLRTDLDISGSEYSWASGIYYIGYLGAAYPVGWLFVRLPVAKVIFGSILIWGVILMLTSVCVNTGGLLANRFFLGTAESAVGPGLTLIVAMWYKRSEQPLRHGAWFMGNVVAGIFGGVVAYGVGHVESIAPWKAVFLVFGALTIVWSVAVFFFLPDTPMSAPFLKPEDRFKAILRVQENMTGIKNNTWKRSQSIEALLDIKLWLLFIIQLAQQIANGGVQGFGSIVIKGFGFSTLNTLLVQMIGQVFQLVFVLICTAGSTFLSNTRTFFMAWNLGCAIVGAAMIRQINNENIWARFMGYCLNIAYSANFPMILAMVSGNVGGFTKKSTANAMIFIAYCAGNIIGPHLFFDDEAPSYPSGFLSMMVCYGFAFVACFALRFYLVWENRRRDRTSSREVLSEEEEVNVNLADMTDKEMVRFRYVY
ncbi:major facilitator superfamily domain-containing protein [Lophiotrema nucula]|uniref:Major facilitator superfamily domain-containing protein n=1 Tax=Lophiotrema nucula TaxID=690887 RepID=A0A6A5ZEU3_9PLEO|nr:major facilitator superfamily domain-containing protein [Lophiotrema nucula]